MYICILSQPQSSQAIINFAEERTSAKENGSLTPNVGRGIGMAIGLGVIVVFASLTQHQVCLLQSIMS